VTCSSIGSVAFFICRKVEALRRKERTEAHLYMSVHVLTEDVFYSHVGHDLHDPDKINPRLIVTPGNIPYLLVLSCMNLLTFKSVIVQGCYNYAMYPHGKLLVIVSPFFALFLFPFIHVRTILSWITKRITFGFFF